MIPPPEFCTARLVLRRPCMEDAPAIFANYAQDPEVTRFLVWRPHENVEETRRIIGLMLGQWDKGEAYSYAILPRDGGSVSGMIALHPDGFKVELGYVLARPQWGRGIMTEAARAVTGWLLEQPDIHRVSAMCDVENPASARVMEKAGMRFEGTLRKYAIHPSLGDEPRDCLLYAVVK
jgi:RimJ/RimL family protein N-acetyltransferase